MARVGHNNPPAGLATIIIGGPTPHGTFFLYDSRNRIWDGENWRGFGEADHFPNWHAAFQARHAARRSAETEIA